MLTRPYWKHHKWRWNVDIHEGDQWYFHAAFDYSGPAVRYAQLYMKEHKDCDRIRVMDNSDSSLLKLIVQPKTSPDYHLYAYGGET